MDTKRNNNYNQEKIEEDLRGKYEDILSDINAVTLKKISVNDIKTFSEKKRKQRIKIFKFRRNISCNTSLEDYYLKEEFYKKIYGSKLPEYILNSLRKDIKFKVGDKYFKSKYEAQFYHKFIYNIEEKYNIDLQQQYKYFDKSMGKRTVDFYIPPFEKDDTLTKGLFIEVTSFNENTSFTPNYKKNQIKKNEFSKNNNLNFILVTPRGKKDFSLDFVIIDEHNNQTKLTNEQDFKQYMKNNYNIDIENNLDHNGNEITQRKEVKLVRIRKISEGMTM